MSHPNHHGHALDLFRHPHNTNKTNIKVKQGTFSADSLSMHATSFQTTAGWRSLLAASSKTHGSTWLHALHLGVGLMDLAIKPGDPTFEEAAAQFDVSFKLKATPESRRNLARVSLVPASWSLVPGSCSLLLATCLLCVVLLLVLINPTPCGNVSPLLVPGDCGARPWHALQSVRPLQGGAGGVGSGGTNRP